MHTKKYIAALQSYVKLMSKCKLPSASFVFWKIRIERATMSDQIFIVFAR